jgi:hypothetical protein
LQLLVLLGKCRVQQIGEAAATAESLIGSRPPRCDGKCAPCGRCEAVQVPVAPRADSRGAGEPRRREGLLFGSAEESYTDYKPLNWRCRCADRRALDPWSIRMLRLRSPRQVSRLQLLMMSPLVYCTYVFFFSLEEELLLVNGRSIHGQEDGLANVLVSIL